MRQFTSTTLMSSSFTESEVQQMIGTRHIEQCISLSNKGSHNDAGYKHQPLAAATDLQRTGRTVQLRPACRHSDESSFCHPVRHMQGCHNLKASKASK